MESGKIAIGILLILLLTINSYSSAELTAWPGELSVIAALDREGFTYIGGYLSKGFLQQPAIGVIRGGEGTLLVFPGRGVILRLEQVKGGVAGFGFLERERGVPEALVVIMESNSLYLAYTVSADVSFHGVDGIELDDGELILVGYVYASRYVGDADVLIARIKDGSVASMRCYGSVGYADIPRKVVYVRNSVVVIGETWSYNVSQGDVLMLSLDRDLRLQASYAIGGAGVDTPEDAVVVGSDIVIVGTTTLEGYGAFVVRVSEVGGLAWLRAFKGFGDTFAVSADYADGELRVLLFTSVEEGVRAPVLLELREKGNWSFDLLRVNIFDSGSLSLSPVNLHRGAVFLWDNGALYEVKNGFTKTWSTSLTGERQVKILNYSELERTIEKTLYGWRSLSGLIEEIPCNISLNMSLLEPTVIRLKMQESHSRAVLGEYARKTTLETLLLRWLERNVPLILLLPVFLIIAVIVLSTTRRKRRFS